MHTTPVVHPVRETAEVAPKVAAYVHQEYWPFLRAGLTQKRPALVREWAILQGVIDQWGHRRLGEVTARDADQWVARLRAQHKSSTYNRWMVRVKHCFRVAERWYGLPSPVAHVKRVRERGRTRTLTPEERDALMTGAGNNLRPYLVLALQTGGRRESLWLLRRRDIDLAAGTVTFPTTKNGEAHTVPLTTTLRGYLFAWWYLRPQDPDGRVLPSVELGSVSQSFRRLCQRLGIRDLHFHDLRHAVGTALGEAGANLPTIMAVTGHRDPRMALRYVHTGRERVREAMEGAL